MIHTTDPKFIENKTDFVVVYNNMVLKVHD